MAQSTNANPPEFAVISPLVSWATAVLPDSITVATAADPFRNMCLYMPETSLLLIHQLLFQVFCRSIHRAWLHVTSWHSMGWYEIEQPIFCRSNLRQTDDVLALNASIQSPKRNTELLAFCVHDCNG